MIRKNQTGLNLKIPQDNAQQDIQGCESQMESAPSYRCDSACKDILVFTLQNSTIGK